MSTSTGEIDSKLWIYEPALDSFAESATCTYFRTIDQKPKLEEKFDQADNWGTTLRKRRRGYSAPPFLYETMVMKCYSREPTQTFLLPKKEKAAILFRH